MNVIEWLMQYLNVILPVLAVIVALAYLWLKDRSGKLALEKIAEVWALIVNLAVDVLASIPEEEFAQLAGIIHAALPAMAKLFVSQEWIKNTLMSLRKALVDELGQEQGKAEVPLEDMRVLNATVRQYLQG